MNTTDLTPLPAHPDVEQYRRQAKDLLSAYRSGDPAALDRVKKYHPHPGSFAIPESKFALADAQVTIAREHGFLSWPKFTKFIEGVARKGAAISAFEAAADAIVEGDEDGLRALLAADPKLIRAKSERVHQCMLIHYVGSNGFENFRQKTPKNAGRILRTLLDAGAEVDAPAGAYGNSTTLGLVATSVHPVRAGVDLELMAMLIEAGADVNGAPGSWTIVTACLANGRGRAARFLADHGAHLNLEAAAGVGELDLVRGFFEPDGSLKATATAKQFIDGFKWASEYGHTAVVAFLLDRGADIAHGEGGGMTALHWAVVGGQVETIELLVSRGAPIEARNGYGGTPLDQALWCVKNGDPGLDYRKVVEVLVKAGSRTVAP